MGKRVKKIEEILEGVDEMKGISSNEADMMVQEMKEMVKEEKGEEIFEEVKKMEKYDFIVVLEKVEWNNEKIKELRKFVKGLKMERGEEGGRKEELILLLEKWGRLGIKEIGEKMGISSKNVSSLLLYLKKSGVKICTDSEGKKFIEK